MALEQQMMMQQPPAQERPQQPTNQESLTDEEETDLETAVLLTERMLRDGGFDVIEQAIDTSSDPAQVIGQFLLQLIKKLDESLPADGKLSRRVYLAKGGWLEQVMDIIIDEFQLDLAIADKAEIYVAQTASELAKAGAAQQQAGAAQPAIPQQGAPV